MLGRVVEDIRTVLQRDPAARGVIEAVLCYPGLHALWLHRVSHWLWHHQFPTVARMISHWNRFLTGIEIHPGAVIGRRCFIDHGMGIVIGETAVIGEDVTMFHGVTLGGRGMQSGKRHPTVGDRVLLGAQAIVLGSVVIGDDAKVGAGAIVTRDVPSGVTVVGNPAREVIKAALGCDAADVIQGPLLMGALESAPVGV